jgi:hypothetical protein
MVGSLLSDSRDHGKAMKHLSLLVSWQSHETSELTRIITKP